MWLQAVWNPGALKSFHIVRAAKLRFFSEKVPNGTVDFIELNLRFGTVPFVSVIIISGIVGVDHSSVGENPGGAEVICFVDVIFQGLISVRPD